MWSKLKGSKKEPKFYKIPTQSEANLADYNKRKDFDFSDGARPESMALPPNLFNIQGLGPDSADTRYNITPHTVSPFIEGLNLEPLTAPVMPAAQPEIKLIPPTPPWVTPLGGSRRSSAAEEGNGSDGEERGRSHRKALSDDTHSRNNSRADAARRNAEAALAFEAVSRALANMQIQKASSATQRAINYSWPLSRQPQTMSPSEAPTTAPVPKQDFPESPQESDNPFEFDN